ncbi:mechanosensitive ion channel domain-containing protein [Novipirellula artificiosorum]|uniref:Mechanosensitive channel MscK n=1 Tax=Novipirellula artificiosorum TaxID=2528016 RepID=A0A5C6DVZ1_9BACT|nr:mechanosensitive ion channel domain-containing protein [Novipirellula artificiosorum]TWU40900.1 Mechanosensitive channel MscK precursor [Novipirellula artificiosorum]
MLHRNNLHCRLTRCGGRLTSASIVSLARLLAAVLLVALVFGMVDSNRSVAQNAFESRSYPTRVYPSSQSATSQPAVSYAPDYRPSTTYPSPPRQAVTQPAYYPIERSRDATYPPRDRVSEVGSGDDRRFTQVATLADPRGDWTTTTAIGEAPPSPYRSTQIAAARQNAAYLRKMAQSTSPVAAKFATENADFADQWAELAETYQQLAIRIDETDATRVTTARDYEDVQSKLRLYGLTPTVGLLLQHKKEQLDQWQAHHSSSLFASQELAESRQHQLELEMVPYDGSDAIGQANEILVNAAVDSTLANTTSLVTQLQDLLRQRAYWLGLLTQGYSDYRLKLGELDSATTAFTSLSNDYRKLIDRHVTWIRSDDPLSLRDVRHLKGGMSALFHSDRSSDFGYSIQRNWKSDPLSGIGLIALIITIGLARWRCKSWLVGIGNRKTLRDTTTNLRKVAAGLLTVSVATALPGMLYAIARWLGNGVVSESTLHASSSLYAASLVTLLVELPRQLLRNHGFIDKHVDIELPRRTNAVRYMTVIGFGLALAAYLITLSGLIDHGMWRASVSRFGFLAAMLLVVWTAHLSLRPSGGFLEPLVAKLGGRVIYRIRLVIYLVGIGFPFALMTLSALGYTFTANELVNRAIITLASVGIALTLWEPVKILSSSAWQLLTGSQPIRQFDEYGEIQSESVSGTLAEHSLELKHHLAFLCQCTLVVGAMVCFGWLWIDVFPNVRMGNPVVWTVQDTVMVSAVDATGHSITRSVVETTPITAMHLLLAAATLFVAFQLAKLLPAMFDALVLQRVSFDEGMEHFTLVLGRCLLFGVGCLVACKWIGIQWKSIEWLAVGLTVGLGFGLQDMVRNLFGGFIVLFEKPARLGDLITVGKVTGRVASQKFRTTVLSDENGREVIVPNKNFVNEDVVHWMGAGRLNVIPIEVAINRSVRPADICRTLQELVIEQPDVLLTPSPHATLVCVGKRSQRIEVRAWIEEGQDPSRFRDALLRLVKDFLREKELLVANQPSQPAMEEKTSGLYPSKHQTVRRRSA